MWYNDNTAVGIYKYGADIAMAVNGWFFCSRPYISLFARYVYTTTGAEISVSGIFGSE